MDFVIDGEVKNDEIEELKDTLRQIVDIA